MRVTSLAIITALQLLLFTVVCTAGAQTKPVPNQDNVSTRSDATVSNPKDEKAKKSAAVKRAQLRKERDAQLKAKTQQ